MLNDVKGVVLLVIYLKLKIGLFFILNIYWSVSL